MAVVYGPASAAQIANATYRPRRKHHWRLAGSLFVLAIVALNALAQLGGTSETCRKSCALPPPPSSPPVSYGTVFTSSQYHFSLAYDSSYAGKPTGTSDNSIAWTFALKTGGYLDATIFGSSSTAQTPLQAVSAEQSAHFSQFQPLYAVPAAEVGYRTGTGEVYQGEWTPLMGSSSTERLAIMAASQHGVTITLVCEAPKSSDKGEHPDPSGLGIGADQFCDQVGNTVQWKH
jgi:hypothetical protein